MPNYDPILTRILVQQSRTEVVEKGSRFIGVAYPCGSLDVFKSRKEELEKEFPDATHVTYAFKIQTKGQVIQRFSDAGEPAGTAGRPILMHIEGHGLINVAVFIVRYFGGTKLGAGGLMRAYGQTARQLLQNSQLADHVPLCRLRLSFPYQEQNHLDYLIKKYEATTLERSFGASIELLLSIPSIKKPEFLAELSRELSVEELDDL